MFSKSDLCWGYPQIDLDPASREITTFVTHKGLFRNKRIMFRITSAPEQYQHAIHHVLQSCKGARNISDDVIVYGKGTQNHIQNLEKVLSWLRERGLALSKGICQSHMNRLVFMRYILSAHGTGPDESSETRCASR